MSTYAIGDIHGCNRTFQHLLKQLPLQRGDSLVLLGDLIDRGPDSKGVVDTVWQYQQDGFEVICLRGNHEQLLLDALHDPAKLELWTFNGGARVLRNFGVKHPKDIPNEYLDFFLKMPLWYETKGFLCVHGGLDFSYPDPLSRPERMLWIRRWYGNIDYAWLNGRTVLHGHTPEDISVIETQYQALEQQRYLNLDNGCVYAYMGKLHSDLGRLLALCLDTRELFQQTCIEVPDLI